ncbi:sulfotransferase domain-containing protein [Yoonia sp. BS5-3]|uniref:Sulfotransferase domain-containing protein n=1 Tax=Yoonia phaeophyticola TaxID=3137369 RepID=A0ABZ2V0U9_9RHOB
MMTSRQHYLGPLTDSSRWDQITIRPDDVFVVTPPKCGTTWMQTIVALLLSGDPDIAPDISTNMPWVDIKHRDITELAGRLAAMSERRSMKSHTPLDGLPIDEQAHYICVFRHPLDAHFSFRRHVANIQMPLFKNWYPADETGTAAFHHFLNGQAAGDDCDALPLAHLLRHYKAAKARDARPNVTLIHYADMKRDLPGVFSKLAGLLDVSHDTDTMAALVQAAGFDHMKQHAARYAPAGGRGFFKSDSAFFHSGTHGTWRGKLSDQELTAYDHMMDAQLTASDRDWLENGSGTGIAP